MACRGSVVQIRLTPLNLSSDTYRFQGRFRKDITFAPTYPSLFSQFCTLKCILKIRVYSMLNRAYSMGSLTYSKFD